MCCALACITTDTHAESISTASHSDHRLEGHAMQALAASKQQATIKPFSTDGCSGGLSYAWEQLASTIPAFRKKFGSNPVYESCCVAHDKAYWQGDTVDGYNKRRLADMELKNCVVAVGETRREQLSRELKISPGLIDTSFKYTANMMYYIVRLGGAPCNFMPWRWGYGWPQCFAFE